MDFSIGEELRMMRATVARFVRNELVPLERVVLRREAERGLDDDPLIAPEEEARLNARTKDIGLWGLDVPERYGGQNLGALAKCLVVEQLKYSIVPYVLPPESPNLNLLEACCRGEQIERYLLPYVRGELKSCLALSEAGAGSDIANIRTRAERRNGRWILNGEKIWISNARRADFMIVIALTDAEKKARGGMTAFLIDKGTRGVSIPTSFPMIGEMHPYAVHFDNVELGDEQVLGEVGQAFIPLQNRLGVRRMEIAARCLGLAARCIDLMITQAKERSTFGAPLADRQWWISDSYQELEMARLITYHLAWKVDQGVKDVRREASIAKVQATEMLTRVVDRAIQMFGAMGVSKELPLEYIARVVRIYRIVEGASEVHRWHVARDLLRNGRPEFDV
jgi:(R)-benzylsuccinyl-CoA dehydrogenase